MVKRNNAILGLAFDYEAVKLLPFFNSLHHTGFTGDLVLFINDKTRLPENEHYGFRVITRNIPQLSSARPLLKKFYRMKERRYMAENKQLEWVMDHRQKVTRLLTKQQPFPQWILSFFHKHFHMLTSRFAFYYDFLAREKYEQVFITDVGDVIFQGDVFSQVTPDKLNVFEETSQIRLGQETHNASWIAEGYGEDTLQQLSDAIIRCAGTIHGDYNSIMRFLEDLLLQLFTRPMPYEKLGVDQSIYNYLISYLHRDYIHSYPNGHPVFTMGLVPAAEFSVTPEPLTVITDNAAPAVLHQYNRHPALNRMIWERFGESYQVN